MTSMLNIMTQAQNAISAYESALQASSSNIANLYTTGYKKVDVSFQSIFDNLLSHGGAASSNMGGTNPLQFGQGMTVASSNIDFSQGTLVTGSHLDLAISGSSFFVVSPDGGNTFQYTRAGNFTLDSSGNLTLNGMQVYGMNAASQLVAITGLTPQNGYNHPELLSWTSGGQLVQYTNTNWNAVDISSPYSIALTYFPNPGGLAQATGTTFVATAASGTAATAASPATGGGAYGSITARSREQSNVDYTTETVKALQLQTAMSSNLTMIKLASDMISSFISKLS